MSYSFYIKATRRVDYPRLIQGLKIPRLVAPEGRGTWPEGALHFYRDGVSTRSTEVTLENGAFQVRSMVLAAPEDWELAFRLVEALAQATGSPVEPEDGDPFPASALRGRYNTAWLRHHTDSGINVVTLWAKTQGETITMPGPVREVHIGPRLFAELEAGGPAEGLADRLLAAIRRVQYVDLTGYHPAGIMEVSRRDGDQSFTLSVWGSEQATFFSSPEYLHLVSDDPDAEPVLVPYGVLPSLAGDRLTWLDEKQCLVTAVDAAAWAEIFGRAHSLRVDPFA